MNLMDAVRAVFSKQEIVEVKFADFKTKDGDTLSIEALEVGKLAQITNEAGEKSNAKAGEYTLEDGQIIVIAEDGTISEIKPAEPADKSEEKVEVSAEDVPPTAPSEPAIDLEPRIAQLEEAVMLLVEKVNALESEKSTVEAEMSALKEENEGLKVTTPAAEPVKFKKLDLETKTTKKAESKYTSLFDKHLKK